MHALFFSHPLLQASPQKADVRHHSQFFETALGRVRTEENEDVRVQREHDVMNWCRDEGWLEIDKQQWLLLAMLQRGLALHDKEKCLKKRYVILNCFHTVFTRDCCAIQPRRKERSSAKCAAAGPCPCL